MPGRSKKKRWDDPRPLPVVNVEFAFSGDEITPEKMRSLICNPSYTGLGPFPRLVEDEQWVRAAAQMIRNAEQFLVNLLYVLRQSLGSSDEEPD